ncbi:hypothetical protein H6P81_002946 [Aristolochia fimbriata]|uniref:Bifunctional inhibitor/plant lipid transfer protein/seed storage helical domain-containing protein n=1 Tax=Aristolochia fimbriata TaxID=158543 RepID=A0AAV7FBE7_ARIFI|nr:hypothetical protein H6P81_002946 [Aristolochia fimbriata]
MATAPSVVFTLSVAFTLLVTVPGSDPADCGTQLMLLAPCAPFVQGATTAPAMSCCDNLNSMVKVQAACLCYFLNNTSSLPVNRTLVLRLPEVCNLKVDPSSACPGLLNLPPAATAGSQFVLAPAENSSTAVPPSVVLLPGSSSVGVSSGGVVAAFPLLLSVFMAILVIGRM